MQQNKQNLWLRQKLQIQDFEVWVHLGCDAEEQKYLQPVHYNFEISYETSYESPLLACQTDKLNDAIDYVKITSILKKISLEKKYNLIEHLNQQVFNGVLRYLMENLAEQIKLKNLQAEIKLTVKKIRVPIENLRNGVVFSCEAKL